MNPFLMVWNFQEVAAVNPLLMVWNLQEVAVKQFKQCYNGILMVLESPGSCREAMIDGLDSQGCCCDAICILFQ